MHDDTTIAANLLSLEGDVLEQRLHDLTPEHTDATTFASVVRELLEAADPDYQELSDLSATTIDCCGTGGSGIPRFNTSTAVAFVLAAAGMKVAKFGNRAASSRSGSFDFLAAIGFNGTLSAQASRTMLETHGLAFIFAPAAYPDLARLAAVRKQLGHPTVLNFAGPLLNPCRPKFRLTGVSHARMQQLTSAFLAEHQPDAVGAIVRSACGLDEICPRCGAAAYILDEQRQISGARSRTVPNGSILLPGDKSSGCAAIPQPDEFTPASNAQHFFAIIEGQDCQSDAYNMIVHNSSQALYLCRHGGMPSLTAAREEVATLLRSGSVRSTYRQAREAYETYAG